MLRALPLLFLVQVFSLCHAATFGTVVPVVGGVADLALDEPRQRLYLVNSNRNQIEVYSIPQRRFLTPVAVEQQPLAAAISRNGKSLYVTCHLGNSLNVIDLDQLAVTNRVALPARPEGVAVGGDERVLITTVGTGAGNASNVLLIYDPFASSGSQSLTTVADPTDHHCPAGFARAGQDARVPRSAWMRESGLNPPYTFTTSAARPACRWA